MGISIWQLLIILVIVLLLFGTKKLRSIGADLGGAVKGFRDSVSNEKDEEETSTTQSQLDHDEGERVIEGEAAKQQESEEARR